MDHQRLQPDLRLHHADWGGITGLGVAAGPVVGGAVVQGLSWQWIFWINVPVGLAVAALSAARLRESRGTRPQLDITGMILAGAGLFALTWGPVRAPSAGWGSAEVIGALGAGAVLMAGFLAWERRSRYPMLPLAYFRRRGFATANAVIFFQFPSLVRRRVPAGRVDGGRAGRGGGGGRGARPGEGAGRDTVRAWLARRWQWR